jgi:hypothetical protein
VRIVVTDHEVAVSTHDRIELDARRIAIFASGGESYVISQNADGTLRIEAPSGELMMDVISATPRVTRVTARGSCRACTDRIARGLEGSCKIHRARTHRGPRIVKSPEPRTVECATCGSTIEYEPEDLFRAQSVPGSDDVGPMAVKCPRPRCGGRGYPR